MDKGERNFLIFLFILSGIIFSLTFFLSNIERPKVIAPQKEEETEIEIQLREIEKLKEEFPPTTKSIEEQLKEIEKLRQQIK